MDSTLRLIRVPAIITLAVTLLRLVGELFHWSKRFFNAEAGGQGALVGIAWLVPIFGIYFAVKLVGHGTAVPAGKTVLGGVLGAVGFAGVAFSGVKLLGLNPQVPSLTTLSVFVIASIVGMAVVIRLAPTLGKVMFAYGLAARIPVVIVMLFAILGNWGTHYDVAPGFPADIGPFGKWFLIGVLPQLSFWMVFTMILGCVFGGVAAARPRKGVR